MVHNIYRYCINTVMHLTTFFSDGLVPLITSYNGRMFPKFAIHNNRGHSSIIRASMLLERLFSCSAWIQLLPFDGGKNFIKKKNANNAGIRLYSYPYLILECFLGETILFFSASGICQTGTCN